MSFTLGPGGETYYLEQVHFHSPSEHTFGGGYYPGEAHLVHRNADSSKVIVLGVVLDVSAGAGSVPQLNNTFLGHFWKAGGYMVNFIEQTIEAQSIMPLNPYDSFTPARPGMYAYAGSLTVPPCSPVGWFVFAEPVMISASDLFFLRKSVLLHPKNILSAQGNNNRYTVQPLNQRVVSFTTGYVASPTNAPTSAPTVSSREKASLILGAVALVITLVSAVVLVVISCRVFAPRDPRDDQHKWVQLTSKP